MFDPTAEYPIPFDPSVAVADELTSVPQLYTDPGRNLWCWAACATMVLHHIGHRNVDQCDVASRHLGRACCDPSVACNQTCATDDVLRIFASWGVDGSLFNSWISFGELRDEVRAGRPVEVGLNWNADEGHLVVVRGVQESDGAQRVLVNDPSREYYRGIVRHWELVVGYFGEGMGRWQRTWRDIQPMSAVAGASSESDVEDDENP